MSGLFSECREEDSIPLDALASLGALGRACAIATFRKKSGHISSCFQNVFSKLLETDTKETPMQRVGVRSAYTFGRERKWKTRANAVYLPQLRGTSDGMGGCAARRSVAEEFILSRSDSLWVVAGAAGPAIRSPRRRRVPVSSVRARPRCRHSSGSRRRLGPGS